MIKGDLSGLYSTASDCVTVQGAVNEVEAKGSESMIWEMNNLLNMGMRIAAPSTESRETVIEGAIETGDLGRLSDTDIDIIALGSEMDRGLILTDDYSIQNMCEFLGIDYRGAKEEGIKEEWRWTYRCTGCKRNYRPEKAEKHEYTCPVCGSRIKSRKKK